MIYDILFLNEHFYKVIPHSLAHMLANIPTTSVTPAAWLSIF